MTHFRLNTGPRPLGRIILAFCNTFRINVKNRASRVNLISYGLGIAKTFRLWVYHRTYLLSNVA